jgi:LCP family protein required for cell wall assembly
MAADPGRRRGRPAELSPQDKLLALAGRPRKRWPRRLLITANVVVLALLALGASAYGYVVWRFGQFNRVTVHDLIMPGHDAQSPVVTGGPPLTILAVGSDTRSLGKGASAAFGSSQSVTGQRSDTVMLVRVVPATSSVALLSIPRDLLVPIAGMGTTRINAAFNSGPDLLVKTVEQDLGIDVNHFVVVNFYTFTQIADAIGGVYQYFPAPARDLYSGLTVLHPGCVLLKGSEALSFVRSREYQYYLNGVWQYQLVPESDLARIQRQQDFVKLAIKKAERVALTNPLALNSVLAGITSSLTVDTRFSDSLMLSLARALRHTDAAAIPQWTYPAVNSTAVPGALDPVPAEDQRVVEQFLSYGLPTKKAATSNLVVPVKPASISVAVLNGSGLAGQAGEAAKALRSEGFEVRSTGDATAFDYAKSVVQYGPDGLAAGRVLQAKVRGGAELEAVSSLRGDNLVLVTGRSYAVARAAGSAASAPSTAAAATRQSPPSSVPAPAVAPDSSSYYRGEYVPPGLQPGQVPESCPL